MVLIKSTQMLEYFYHFQEFTFQYGSNQIELEDWYYLNINKFTFQYGSNQMLDIFISSLIK